MHDNPLRASGPASLADVADALGTRSFGPRMAAYADAAFGGHVFFAYHHRLGKLMALAAGHVPPDPTNALVTNIWRYSQQRLWEQDVSLTRAMSRLDGAANYADFHDRGASETKRNWPWHLPTPIVDKILLCQGSDAGTVVLIFSRWGECAEFDCQQTDLAAETGVLLMSLASAHRRLLLLQADPCSAFGSCDEIERCLARTTHLTRRERQVSALQLLGIGGAEIGTELGIEPESVKSYRKRAYVRLGVSSERELLLKFLSLRAAGGNRVADLEAPIDPWKMPFLLA